LQGHLPNQQHSQTVRFITAIEAKATATNTTVPSCIKELAVHFKEKKRVLSSVVEELQSLGWIPKKTSRGKTKK